MADNTPDPAEKKPVKKPAEKKPAPPKKAPPPVPAEGAEGAEASENITETPPETTPETIQKEKPAAQPKPKPKPSARRGAGVWGIDLGQCSLKAVRLEEIDGVVQATAFDYIEHPKILSQPDADRDALIREALDKLLANNNRLRGDQVAISVPGQSALTRFVKLPPVQKDKIADIVKFEAKQQIPFNLNEVIWDFQKIGEGTEVENFAMDTEIGLFAMKKDAIHAALQHFKDVGVEVDYVQIAPLALCNYVTYDLMGITPGAESSSANNCVVALDIGADSTNLVITDGAKTIWQKVISTGGNHFTRALTKDLKLTFAKAEHTKRNAAKSKDLKQILASLKPVLNDFEGEIKRSLNFFQNSHRSAQLEYIIGMGNAFRLPGMQKFLEEKLGMPVKRLQKFTRLTGDAVLNAPVFHENLSTFATAYGLALQGLKKSRLITNLLPPELRTERMIRAKKPWAVAAAALLLLGLGAVALRYGIEYNVYADPSISKAITTAKSTAKQANEVNTAFENARRAALGEEEGVKSVISGQKEHTNWLELLNFVSSAVPRPDGSNLEKINPQAYAKYFTNTSRNGGLSGKVAFQRYLEKQGTLQLAALPEEPMVGTTPPIGPTPFPMGPGTPMNPGATPEEDLPPFVSDLVQFNIESVDARYSSNLENFFTEVRKRQTDKGNYQPLSAYNGPPKNPYTGKPGEANEKGWVVELRGYTFHADARSFIINTLMENIARMGRPDLDKTPAPMPMPMDMVPGMEPAAPTTPERGPVLNRISHVILLEYTQTPTSDTTNLKYAGMSLLDQLVREGTGTGGLPGGPNPAMPAGPPPGVPPMIGGEGSQTGGSTGPSRDAWQPLGAAGTAGTGPGALPGGRPPFNPVPIPGAGPGVNPPPTKSRHMRTEFIVLFVWYEPTPSDLLRPEGDPAANPAGGFPGGPAPGR